MQITEHIHLLKVPFQIQNPGATLEGFVNVYLIFGKEICLIGTGVAGSEKVIFEYIEKNGRDPSELSLMILSYSHPEHIGAARAIKDAVGCTTAAHAGEIAWIEDTELQFKERTIPGFHSLVGGSLKVDQVLQDGEIITLEDELKLQVFHTPGHSKGAISLMLLSEQALFSGDVVPLPGDIPMYEDILVSMKSIQKLSSIEGIKVLLTARDKPRQHQKAYDVLEAGLKYLQRIHEVVVNNACAYASLSEPQWCRTILEELGISTAVANPLVGRSFISHLEYRDMANLLDDL